MLTNRMIQHCQLPSSEVVKLDPHQSLRLMCQDPPLFLYLGQVLTGLHCHLNHLLPFLFKLKQGLIRRQQQQHSPEDHLIEELHYYVAEESQMYQGLWLLLEYYF